MNTPNSNGPSLKCLSCGNHLKLPNDVIASSFALINFPSGDDEFGDIGSEPEIMIPTASALSMFPSEIISSTESYDECTSDDLQAHIQHGLPLNSKLSAYFFDFLTGQTDVDHPMCQNCADSLLDAQQRSLNSAKEELAALESYYSYLLQQQNDNHSKPLDGTSTDFGGVEMELSADGNISEGEEERLLIELANLEEEENHLDKQIQLRKGEVAKKNEEFDALIKQLNIVRLEVADTEEELRIHEARDKYLRHKFSILRRTNALHMAFELHHDGHIGVINGLRLGRLPSCPVDWPEINAAWGMALFLLQTIAKNLNVDFPNYKFKLMGATSAIRVVSENKEYPLYHGGYRIFNDSKRFDNAMIAFCACVSEVALKVSKIDNVQIPFRFLNDGGVQDEASGEIYRVNYSRNNEENWTKALKSLIIVLKYFLPCISARKINENVSILS